MNIAVIFAGGTGRRMRTKDLPKQFLQVYGKPIIIHTMQIFDTHDDIDAIVVSCIKEWIPYLNGLVESYNLRKVKSVVAGGGNGQESIYRGLLAAKAIAYEEAIVLIHDGVRPFISHEVIDDNIRSVREHGTAITTSKVTETLLIVDETALINKVPDRDNSRIAKAPQSFWLDDILDAHNKAISEGKNNFIDSCTMMQYYGHPLYLVDGPGENIKVTTQEDIFTMRAVLEAKEIMKMQENYD